jgi:hypothetical protein
MEKEILKTLSKWAFEETKKEVDLNEAKDTLNKLSEIIYTLSNFCKSNNENEKQILQNALESWSKGEKTNIDFTAKYR